jgi:hypothetical protein
MTATEHATKDANRFEFDQRHLNNWWGPASTPKQRAIVGALAMVVATATMITLNAFAGVDDWAMIIPFVVVAIAVGLYVRQWMAVPAAYAGWVGTLIVSEVALYLIMGASWWEERNAEHWLGTETAFVKLMGQLMEIAVLGLFIAVLAGLGALVGWLIHRLVSRE